METKRKLGLGREETSFFLKGICVSESMFIPAEGQCLRLRGEAIKIKRHLVYSERIWIYFFFNKEQKYITVKHIFEHSSRMTFKSQIFQNK